MALFCAGGPTVEALLWVLPFFCFGNAYVLEPRAALHLSYQIFLGVTYSVLLGGFGVMLRRQFKHGGISAGWRDAIGVGGCVVLLLACNVLPYLRTPGEPAVTSHAAPSSTLPNVILITLDTVRADHVSLCGYARNTTPHLRLFADRLATVYTRAVAPSNWTLSSHASIFTGLYPTEHGAIRSADAPTGKPLSPGVLTLAEWLSAHGYLSAAVIANYGYLAPHFNLNRGFSYYDARRPIVPGRGLLDDFLMLGLAWMSEVGSYRPYRSASEITDEAVALMRGFATQERPFFMFVNYMDAHQPYVPPSPYLTRFTTGPRLPRIQPYASDVRLTPQEQVFAEGAYDGAIAYVDEELSRFMKDVERAGIMDSCLIIVTSDHGEEFGDDGKYGHGFSVRESEVHVPLVVKYPFQEEPARVDAVASGIDVFPTVVRAVGLNVPQRFRGYDLQELPRQRWVLSEGFSGGMTVRAGVLENMKLIAKPGRQPELYDLERDPGERHSLWDQQPVLAGMMADGLNGAQRTLHAAETGRAVLDPELLERLRSLGYVK